MESSYFFGLMFFFHKIQKIFIEKNFILFLHFNFLAVKFSWKVITIQVLSHVNLNKLLYKPSVTY